MATFFSKLISVLFHPIFMPMLSLLLIFNSEGIINVYYSDHNGAGVMRNRIYLVFLITTVIMPAISFLILRRNGMVSSFAMPNRNERFLPYTTTLIYYGILYYLLRASHFPSFFLSAVMGTIVVMLCILIVNIKIKVSAHAAGIAGVVAIYAVMMKQSWILHGLNPLAGLIVLAGLVCTARLVLQAHRSVEVFLGIAIGFFCEYIVMNFKFII